MAQTDNRTATEVLEQVYMPTEESLINHFRQKGKTDEEILEFMKEFS